MVSSYMVGIAWYAYFTHYPLFSYINNSDFSVYHSRYVLSTTFPIAIPMVLELALCCWLLAIDLREFWIIQLAVISLIWGVTFLWSVPYHNKIEKVFKIETHSHLIVSHLVRSLLWSAKLIILFFYIRNSL